MTLAVEDLRTLMAALRALPVEAEWRWTVSPEIDLLCREILADAVRLLVLQCERCDGWTDTLRERKCLSCASRPWQYNAHRGADELTVWKPSPPTDRRSITPNSVGKGLPLGTVA